MSTFTIKEDGSFGECMPFTIYRDDVPVLAIVGQGEPLSPPTDAERQNAEMVRLAMENADKLIRLSGAVQAHTNRLDLNEHDATALRGALEIARDRYRQIAQEMRAQPGHLRLAEQFDRQAADTERLIEQLDD